MTTKFWTVEQDRRTIPLNIKYLDFPNLSITFVESFMKKMLFRFLFLLNLHKDSDWLLFTPFWTCSASIDRKHLRHSNKTQRIRHWRIKNHSRYEHLAAIQSLYICGWCGLSRGGSVGCWCTFKCRLRVNINNNGNNNDFLVFVSNVGSIFRISNISNVIYF